jgi:hypothetical protein
MIPRSLFFKYTGSGDVLTDAKGKVSVSFSGWKVVPSRSEVKEVTCPKSLHTWPIKFSATLLEDALRPNLSLVRIKEPQFVAFLIKEGAEDDHWTMRFWEIDQKKGTCRTITAGKETPKLWRETVESINNAGRAYQWAGVEFTHAKLHRRVMIHRWPVASIALWGRGNGEYAKIKERFVSFLREIV